MSTSKPPNNPSPPLPELQLRSAPKHSAPPSEPVSPTSSTPSRTTDASPRPSLQRHPARTHLPPWCAAPPASHPPQAVVQLGYDEYDDTVGSSENMFSEVVEGAPTSPARNDTREESTLRRLREEMNAKLALSQKQVNIRQGLPRTNSGQGLGARRVSPIKEEPIASMSPSLEVSFNSPLPAGAQTSSTESTESTRSGKTVRGTIQPSSTQAAVQTPSYPFPHVPGTPRTWSSSFHKPFTTLSPTASSTRVTGGASTPRESITSDTSTPVASVGTFMPAGATTTLRSDPQYPTPNLYELVLTLNAEPGLDTWWSTLSRIMCEGYNAERLSLAVPADAGELENVPWGQKATFSRSGRPEVRPTFAPRGPFDSKSGDAPLRNVFDDNISASSSSAIRPKLQLRHSYAGFERSKRDVASTRLTAARPSRPRGPLRTTSYAPSATPTSSLDEYDGHDERPGTGATSLQTPNRRPAQLKSFSDLEFSTSGSEQPSCPYEEVLPVLRALNYEVHALLDTVGVNKVLDRAKVVTLTRDYSDEAAARGAFATPQQSEHSASALASKFQATRQSKSEPQDLAEQKGPLQRLAADYFARPGTGPAYEEYEQFPSSPWSQSPAPSPAIPADAEDNPFFATGTVDEDSFNPTGTPQDYSKLNQVEAIGVEKACTVIHIPIIHPILSHLLPTRPLSYGIDTPTCSASDLKHDLPDTPMSGKGPRRAPLAILSILSPVVPYPQNLVQSLKLLAPHLATSFSNAQQYSGLHRQASSFTRRLSAGHSIGLEPTNSEVLRDIMEADIDVSNGSATGSITSPSDYSGRSRASPGGSIVGTPAWEPMNLGFSSRHTVGNTPGHLTGSDIVDSYFDMKKRTPAHRSESRAVSQHVQRYIGDTSPAPLDTHHFKNPGALDENKDRPRAEQKANWHSTWDERKGAGDSSPKRVRIGSPKMNPVTVQQQPERTKHTLLPSYGADFSSSFQSLPVAATPTARTPAISGGSGRGPEEEVQDMPPPSERLLRTIIDALPVQIFTAAPGTGIFTWVNSKFLVYRGQDPQQILQDPWQALHPEDREHYMDEWQRCLNTGQQFSHKVRLKRFDSAFRWFYVRATPLMDKKLKIVHWAGTNMDIHEQHLAEMSASRQQETAASEAKYRALANSSPQVVFAVTRTRGVTFCNSQWPTYSGQTEEQARGLGFMNFVHPDDLAKCRLPTFNEDGSLVVDVPTSLPPEVRRRDSSRSSSDELSEIGKTVTSPGVVSPAAVAMPQAKLSKLATAGILKVSRDPDGRPSYSTEVRLRSKEGEHRWHLVRVLLSDAVRKGDVEEEETWYGTCTDINDHKVLEQTLKDTMDAKSRFLSNMSHEIRTPLNGITGMVNFLIDSNLTAEQMEHVNIIRNSTEGLRDLINDILDLSKVEAGMITLQVEWMHIRSLIEEVNDLTSAMAIDKGLELNYIVEDNVPSMVKGDRFRIRQVLLNVVGNAIKFTQHGEVFVRCSIDPNRGEENEEAITLADNEILVSFAVIDTGAGFTEEEARFLFKRFSQIDSSSTKQHSGTGLGLAISMQLVELHGGHMKATSRPGEGSIFTFSIKFTLPSATDHPPVHSSTPGLIPGRTLASTPHSASDQLSFIPEKVAFPESFALPGRSEIESPAVSISSISDRHKSSVASSGSSDPSIRTAQTSIHSTMSSSSSIHSSEALIPNSPPINLELPSDSRSRRSDDDAATSSSHASTDTLTAVSPSTGLRTQTQSPLRPQIYSILLVCPMQHARDATFKHIEMTIPKSSPHHITPRANLQECIHMFGTEDPVIFTHVVLVLRHVDDIIAFIDKIFTSSAHTNTAVVVVTDLAQKRDIIANSKNRYNYDQFQVDHRIRFVFKPSKPSKFADIFDPQREGEVSQDRSQNSAQALAVSQKQVFEMLKKRLGGKDIRVLLVEDNRTNQMVLQKFLKKVDIACDVCMDGVQCTERVFDEVHGFYSIILCDLHMPNKDGYQTCKDIRRWERRNKYPNMPIIALSANVLGDVYSKCVDAGFNSYVTKPVDFKELGDVLSQFLDPADTSKPHPFMRPKSG